MERLFGVEEPNISAWRRRTCGDLTASLNLKQPPARSFPGLPETRNYMLDQYVTSQDQPAPTVPTIQTLPTQEPGSRPAGPLIWPAHYRAIRLETPLRDDPISRSTRDQVTRRGWWWRVGGCRG